MVVRGDQQNDELVREFCGRFVILTHDHPFLHWDLMLEDGGMLRTWRLLHEPTPDSIIVAEPLPDHRSHYLDYEGPVSRGRGSVQRWDRGHHATRETSAGWIVSIAGERLVSGTIELTADADGSAWTFRFSE